MATVAKNNIKKAIEMKAVLDDISGFVSSSISFNAGDLLYLDTTNHLVKPVSLDIHSQALLGVSRVTVKSGLLVTNAQGIYDADASAATLKIAGPVYGVEAEFVLKTGDSINPGDSVYTAATVDAQTVSASAGTSGAVIGVYMGAAISSAAAGTKVVVKLGTRYPENVLKY